MPPSSAAAGPRRPGALLAPVQRQWQPVARRWGLEQPPGHHMPAARLLADALRGPRPPSRPCMPSTSAGAARRRHAAPGSRRDRAAAAWGP